MKTKSQDKWYCVLGRCPAGNRPFISDVAMEKHYAVWHDNPLYALVRISKKVSTEKPEADK